jgi:ABC-type nitrate/sulfonate/bicarbonate transport system substrate-binding protein
MFRELWSAGDRKAGRPKREAGWHRPTRRGCGSRFAPGVIPVGLNPDKDLTFLQVPGGEPARIAALSANSIDVSLINPPYHKKGIDAGLKVLANMEDMDIPIQHIGLVTIQRLINKSPDVIRRTVKSYVEGIQVMRTNPKLAKAGLTKYMRISDDGELEETYQLLKKLVPSNPIRLLKGLEWCWTS